MNTDNNIRHLPADHISHDEFRMLVGKFMDGATSIAEEKKIYRFFETATVETMPDNLRHMREMFAWYAGGLGHAERTERDSTSSKTASDAGDRLNWWQWLSVAAMVTLLIGSGWTISAHQRQLNSSYAQYEGSYIIRNGERITDIKEIFPELIETENAADNLDDIPQSVIDRFAPDDSAAKEAIADALSDM